MSLRILTAQRTRYCAFIKAAGTCDIYRQDATPTRHLPPLTATRGTISSRRIFVTPKAYDSNIFQDLFEQKRDPNAPPYAEQVLKELGGRERGIELHKDGRVSTQNPFKLFLLEERLFIKESKLRQQMVKMQRALHPDKFYRQDKLSRGMSDQLSAIVNEAYDILRHPYKRAIQLLSLKSNKSMSQLESSLDKLQVEPDFLSRMMELRETIEETRDTNELSRLAIRTESELNVILKSLEADFATQDYDLVLKKLGKLKFLSNCHVLLMDRLEGFSKF